MSKYLFTIIFFLIIFQSFSQNNIDWQKVDSLENSKLFKEALELSEQLHSKAENSNNLSETYKKILYQLKYKSQLGAPLSDIIIFTQQEADMAKSPLKNVLHALIVDLYLNYYQNNYRSVQENICFENLPCENLQDWSLERLQKEIMRHILLSLSDKEEIQNIKSGNYKNILLQRNTEKNYQKSVYDFLAYKALSFLENKQWLPLNTDEHFSIPDSLLLLPGIEFIKQNFPTEDTLSPEYIKLNIYKELIKEHVQSKDVKAVLYADLHRFKYFNTKNNLYEESLKNIIKKYEKYKECSAFYYLLANYYYQIEPIQKQIFNSRRIKALNICEQVINKYPESIGSKQCANLKSKILNKSLCFAIDEVLNPKDSFDIDLYYQNMDTVYIKMAKIDQNILTELRNRYSGKELYEEILRASKTNNISTHILHQSNDYYPHTTKIRLKSPATGKYLIFISNNKLFSYKNNVTSYADFTSSRISYMNRKLPNGSLEYYVIDRKSGSPIGNAALKIYEKSINYKSGKIEKRLISNVHADENAHFIIEAKQKTSLKELYLEFYKGKDVLRTKKPVLLYPLNNLEQNNIKVQIITDKIYYQSGEILYFKAIIVNTGNKSTELIDHQKVPLIIKANNTILSEKIYSSNQYGSFSSQFKIPEYLKSGELEIYTPYGSKFVKINEDRREKNFSSTNHLKEKEKNDIFRLTKSIQNDTLTLTINTKEKKLNLLYELIIDNENISHKWITVNKNSSQIKQPINSASSIKINLTSIKNNILTTHTEEFNKSCLNKKLKIDIQNLKTKNISNSNVEWKIQVRDTENNPVQSEVLVFLSESRDYLNEFNKLFNLICAKKNVQAWTLPNNKQQKAEVLSLFLNQFSPLPYENFYYLNLYGFQFPKQSLVYATHKQFHIDKVFKKPKNLAKTEFFFPSLKSDAKGLVQLSIHLPRTTSKQYINILAISKNSQFGYFSKTLLIKKILKIEIEKPAFYRLGDVPMISAKLINNSNDTLKGTVRLLLYQNGFNKILGENEKLEKKFQLLPHEKNTVYWKIRIPGYMNNLQYKIEAKSAQYIDIKHNNIAILSTRTSINENNLPIIRRETPSVNDTLNSVIDNNIFINKSLQLVNKLSNTLSKNAIDLLLNYFTNSVKFQYLKNAKDKRFQNINLLSSFQNKNGSWSWFQKMPGDFEISTYIVSGFGRMQKLDLVDIKKDVAIRKIVVPTIYYLDKYLFQQYLSGNSEFINNDILLNYFYARSYFYEIPVSDTYKRAIEFYKDYLTQESKKFTFEEKLIYAIIIKRNNQEKPKDIEKQIEKLKNKSLSSKNLALYIEYLTEYKKSSKQVNQYISYFDSFSTENKKILACAAYVLLLNKNITKNTDNKLAEIPINKLKTDLKELKITKELYTIANGKLQKLRDKDQLMLNDTITVKIKIKSKKPIKYLLLSDNYPALFQPLNIQEKIINNNQQVYYQNQNTGKVNFYVYELNKGINTIEYKVVVKHKGIYNDQGVFIKQLYNNKSSFGKKYIRSTGLVE